MSQADESGAGGENGEEPTSQLRMMVSRGRSFSGHERNCAFLNLGGRDGAAPSFANISVGSGLDFPDDGRAVALCDLDDDGDLDLWISNRNGPRLRLMRNDTPRGRHFLSLRLQGNGIDTNCDAIGARVEVFTPAGKSMATLRAGEGFLSQSSMGLHFGLGDSGRIEKVVVRWPDREGTAEVFSGIEADGRYLLVQGKGEAVAAKPRVVPALVPSVQKAPPVSRAARIPMVTLLKAPALRISDQSGKTVELGGGKPVLINLWASWCAPCLVELAEIAKRETEIRAAGIDVVALSVDVLNSEEPKVAAAAAGAAIRKLDFPFVSAIASEQIVGLLQWHHDNAVGRKRRLPLPSSFLIDARGHVAVTYKGPLTIDSLLADVAHSSGTLRERWTRAAMLPGRVIDHDSVRQSAAKIEAKLYFDHAQHQESLGAVDLAIHYYGEALNNRPGFDLALRGLGNLYAQRAQWKEALPHFAQLVALKPEDAAARYALAVCHQQLGESAEARTHFEKTVVLQPDHVRALDALGTMELVEGNGAAAIGYFRGVLRVAPAHASARNNLAWILATSREDALRSGVEALELAQALVEGDGGKNPMFFDTLAAAQAETGDFEGALASARKGLEMARAIQNKAVAEQIEKRTPSYERREAYRE